MPIQKTPSSEGVFFCLKRATGTFLNGKTILVLTGKIDSANTEPEVSQALIFSIGVDWYEGPPVPIPNTEVKLTSADDTCRVTGRENR